MVLKSLNRLLFSVALCSIITFLGCGGKSSTGTKEQLDGRILIRNETTASLRVSYYDELAGNLEMVVPSKETKEVTQSLLKGGLKVLLSFTSIGSPEGPECQLCPTQQKVEVTINGNVTVRMYGPLRGGATNIAYEILSQ